MRKKTLIIVDRDGTLIYDKKYYIGRTNLWKKKIRFLPKVIEGLKVLNKIPDSLVYIVTHQPGVAVKDFSLLTEERANMVLEEVVKRIERRGAKIDGYFMCPHASPAYARRKKDFKFVKKYICNCSCIKPGSGMIEQALKDAGLKKSQVNIYIIGDRLSDVQTALNSGGFGILVPFVNEPGQDVKVMELNTKNKYIAKHFLDAAKFIAKKEK